MSAGVAGADGPVVAAGLFEGAEVVVRTGIAAPPLQAVTVTSAEGGDFELHLWIITAEVKRRGGGQ